MSSPWRRNLENLTISCPFKAACCGRGVGELEQTGPGGGGEGETVTTYVHSLSIYYVLVRLLVNDGIGPEELQLLTSRVRTVQKPQTSRRLLASFAESCRSVHVDRLEGKCANVYG